MKSTEDLDVFKKTHSLVLKLYKITYDFPKEEKYGLVSQIRRAASSINANLMEGSHRRTIGDYKRFIGIARGSVGELKYHLLIAKDLNYINKNIYIRCRERTDEVNRMLTGLLNSL